MYVLVQQRCVDFERWLDQFTALAPVRAEQGLATVMLARNSADPDEVVVVFATEDMERATEYMNGTALAEAWRQGTVVPESTQVSVLTEVDAAT